MTISTRPPRNQAVLTFAEALTETVKGRGLAWSDLGRQLGVQQRTMRSYGLGAVLPSLELGTELATLLDAPTLALLLRRALTKRCVNESCRQPFIPRLNNIRYCSPICQRVVAKRRQGLDVRYRAASAERLLQDAEGVLREVRTAVAAFCHGCEPDGICRMADCQLRSVSPLPFVAPTEIRVIKPLNLRDEPRPHRQAS